MASTVFAYGEVCEAVDFGLHVERVKFGVDSIIIMPVYKVYLSK
jgi:hypothetical protein